MRFVGVDKYFQDYLDYTMVVHTIAFVAGLHRLFDTIAEVIVHRGKVVDGAQV
jgi:hypothetical protein